MKVLELARPNLPPKPTRSAKPAVKGASKPEALTVDDDDEIEAAAAATVSKPSSAMSGKVAGKAGKPTSAAVSATSKKVQFLFCMALLFSCVH